MNLLTARCAWCSRSLEAVPRSSASCFCRQVDEVDASVLEVNRLLGEITVQSPVAEQTNSTIVRNVLTIERKHLVRVAFGPAVG